MVLDPVALPTFLIFPPSTALTLPLRCSSLCRSRARLPTLALRHSSWYSPPPSLPFTLPPQADDEAPPCAQPQPSLASLAQLACDLIVHNYGLELVGYLGLQDHVPAVGARDSLPGLPDQPGLALACEGEHPRSLAPGGHCIADTLFPARARTAVFATPNRSLVIALPRSPIIRARRRHYLDSIRHWIHHSNFSEVLVVAGADAAMRGDDGLNALTPLRHILTTRSEDPSRLATTLRQISPSYLSSSPSGFQSSSEVAAHSSDGTTIPPIPHGGLTRQLLTALLPESNSEGGGADSTTTTPAVDALIVYTSEGAASESAHFLADALAYVLEPQLADLEDRIERSSSSSSSPRGGEEEGDHLGGLMIGGQKGNVKWKEPKSWERGLLGPELARDAGREMYG